MFNVNHYKLRSAKLSQLGFKSYLEYLNSDAWSQRKARYAEACPPRCRYCGKPADDLHHRTYKRLGCEADEDLEWLCRHHHAEAHDRGFIGKPTEPMRTILRGHGYGDAQLDHLTFGDAYRLIGELRTSYLTGR